MRNYSKNKKTMMIEISDQVPFIKIKDLFPKTKKFEKGEVPILGYLKTHSSKYDNDNYSLLVNVKGEYYLMNVPQWYGEALAKDFLDSGVEATEFFDNSYIKEIEDIETKKGNNTYNIIIYED